MTTLAMFGHFFGFCSGPLAAWSRATEQRRAASGSTPVLYHGGKFPRTIHSHRTNRTANEVRQCLSEASFSTVLADC
ncbi:TPA: hypothetical protein RQL16_003370 [Vibrio vulnificus]|nr:hypothetical protein [Vibrio vulnificus]HDY8219513.1 hypothetical protein [Vibrio vulnificus]